MPQSDRGEFSVSMELEPGTSIEQNNQTTLRVERIFSQMPEIEKVFTGVGSQAMGSLSLSSDNLTQLNVTLIPKEKRKKSTTQVGEEIKVKLKEIPGLKVFVNPIGIFGAANQSSIQIAVNGTDFAAITQRMFGSLRSPVSRRCGSKSTGRRWPSLASRFPTLEQR
jgi:HAE1 family hydrophobic/amphiphilic exporter-1